jgi:drug/metabolite transporter (DMT)-like permease
MSRRGWILFVAMGVMWGIPYLLIRVAVRDLSPSTLVLGRTAIAALMLLPLAAARGQLAPLWRRRGALLFYTVVEIAVPWLLLSHAETRLTSSLAGLLVAAVPLVSVVLGRLTGEADRPDGRRIFGLVLGLAGVAALVGLDVGGSDALAAVEVGVVAVCYASGPLIISHHLRDMPGLGVVASSLALSALIFVVPGLASLPGDAPSWQAVAATVVLGVVCSAIAFLVFFQLIREAGPIRASTITYVNPAVAVFAGAVFLDESFTLGMAVGLVLILGGSYMATRRSQAAAPAEAAAPARASSPGAPP